MKIFFITFICILLTFQLFGQYTIEFELKDALSKKLISGAKITVSTINWDTFVYTTNGIAKITIPKKIKNQSLSGQAFTIKFEHRDYDSDSISNLLISWNNQSSIKFPYKLFWKETEHIRKKIFEQKMNELKKLSLQVKELNDSIVGLNEKNEILSYMLKSLKRDLFEDSIKIANQDFEIKDLLKRLDYYELLVSKIRQQLVEFDDFMDFIYAYKPKEVYPAANKIDRNGFYKKTSNLNKWKNTVIRLDLADSISNEIDISKFKGKILYIEIIDIDKNKSVKSSFESEPFRYKVIFDGISPLVFPHGENFYKDHNGSLNFKAHFYYGNIEKPFFPQIFTFKHKKFLGIF